MGFIVHLLLRRLRNSTCQNGVGAMTLGRGFVAVTCLPGPNLARISGVSISKIHFSSSIAAQLHPAWAVLVVEWLLASYACQLGSQAAADEEEHALMVK